MLRSVWDGIRGYVMGSGVATIVWLRCQCSRLCSGLYLGIVSSLVAVVDGASPSLWRRFLPPLPPGRGGEERGEERPVLSVVNSASSRSTVILEVAGLKQEVSGADGPADQRGGAPPAEQPLSDGSRPPGRLPPSEDVFMMSEDSSQTRKVSSCDCEYELLLRLIRRERYDSVGGGRPDRPDGVSIEFFFVFIIIWSHFMFFHFFIIKKMIWVPHF